MAYNLQDKFDREEQPFKVEAVCQSMIQDLTSFGDGSALLDRS
jgi:hypothetical protein